MVENTIKDIKSFTIDIDQGDVIDKDGEKISLPLRKFLLELIKSIAPEDQKNILSLLDMKNLSNEYKNGNITLYIPYRDANMVNKIIRVYLMMKEGELLAKCLIENYEKIIEQQKHLENLASLDPLTKTFNRVYMAKLVNEHCAKSNSTPYALMIINILAFDSFVERHGRTAGEKLIIEISKVLISLFASDSVSCFGNEFVIFKKNVQSKEDIMTQAKNIQYALSKIALPYKEAKVACIIGVSIGPDDGTDFSTLMARADFALDLCKKNHEKTILIYGDNVSNKKNIKESLDDSYNGKLSVFYDKEIRRLLLNYICTQTIITILFILAICILFISKIEILYLILGITFTAGLFIFGTSSIFLKWRKEISLVHSGSIDLLTDGLSASRFAKDAQLYVEHFSYKYTIVAVNINQFKKINRLMGNNRGTEVIIELSKIINSQLQNYELVSHLYADKYVMLLETMNPEKIQKRFESITEKFLESLDNVVKNQVKLDFGVCPISVGKRSIKQYIDSVLLIMDDKRQIRNYGSYNVAYYNNRYQTTLEREKTLESRLDTAIENGELRLFLQPKYDFKYSAINSAEALIRWHDEFGIVSNPSEFIPLFERNGDIIKIDEFVFESVCEFLQKIHDDGKKTPRVSINISRVHFEKDNFIEPFVKIFSRYSFDPSSIEFEMNETVISLYASQIDKILSTIHNYGFKCSIDAFGSGQISLNVLKHMEIDIVKLDRDFFNIDDFSNVKSKIIIRDIVQLIKRLGIQVVAEGVEMKEQCEFLKEIKCDYMQGYYLDRPMEVAEFIRKYVV